MVLRNDIVRKTVFTVSLILAAVWMCVIFGFSSNDAEESTAQSNTVTRFIIGMLNPEFDNMSEEQQQEMIDELDGIVRKIAHFTAYAVLGALLCVSIYHAPFAVSKPCLWPMTICAVFAVTDEYHQTFVDGRAGQLKDVIIDSLGAACGIAFAAVVIILIKKKMQNKRET